ncbi:MAG: hypothetical protein HY744_32980, partial [Deltaproteobacteria bacterium]|nr:hypothetical protein [Deltaproteobacteria bacterium]
CVDTDADPANCGGCGNACPQGQVCSAEKCAMVCVGGTTKCGNVCVDAKSDPANCGSCGNACPQGQACAAGQCGLVCAGGTTKCGSACVDVKVDPANCGSCGNACPQGQVCSSGSCTLVCGGGTTKCGNACVNTSWDPNNCGSCGNACGVNKLCNQGKCTGGSTIPGFSGELGPDMSGDGWLQCEGYLDKPGGDEVPKTWGDSCTDNQYNKLRVVCGAAPNTYRYITVNKNVFRDGLAGYPENGLILEAKDQNGQNFTITNQIYANGNHPHNGVSWWNGGDGCSESSTNITVNNICSWEASNCFGQNLGGNRYLWVYVKP